MDYMAYFDNMPQQIIEKMSLATFPETLPAIFAFLLCSTLGFMLYIWALRVMAREGKDVYPLYMHCWMLSIDFIGTLTFWTLAFQYDFFWMFTLYGLLLPVWMCLEIRCIVFAIKDEQTRQEEFGLITKTPVTVGEAVLYCVGTWAVSFSVNMYILSCLGGFDNCAIFMLYMITNNVIIYWSWRYWREHATMNGYRSNNAMGVQIIMLIQVTIQWIPGLSWYLAVSPFFDQPWFYLMGIVCSAVQAYNTYMTWKTPAKPESASIVPGKKPIW